jgi:hypothetical protein
MTTIFDINARSQSRREILSKLAVIAGGGAVIAAVAAAPAAAKVSPKDVGYQPTPKGAARCDNCIQWEPPHACKLVSGVISPSGWCSIWAHK